MYAVDEITEDYYMILGYFLNSSTNL